MRPINVYYEAAGIMHALEKCEGEKYNICPKTKREAHCEH